MVRLLINFIRLVSVSVKRWWIFTYIKSEYIKMFLYEDGMKSFKFLLEVELAAPFWQLYLSAVLPGCLRELVCIVITMLFYKVVEFYCLSNIEKNIFLSEFCLLSAPSLTSNVVVQAFKVLSVLEDQNTQQPKKSFKRSRKAYEWPPTETGGRKKGRII